MFAGIVAGFLGVILTSSNRPTFGPVSAFMFRAGMAILLFASIYVIVNVLRANPTRMGHHLDINQWLIDNPNPTLADLNAELVIKFYILSDYNIRLTRNTRQSFNIALFAVSLGIILILISLWVVVPLPVAS
jgi:uncharacterized membrane protein